MPFRYFRALDGQNKSNCNNTRPLDTDNNPEQKASSDSVGEGKSIASGQLMALEPRYLFDGAASANDPSQNPLDDPDQLFDLQV